MRRATPVAAAPQGTSGIPMVFGCGGGYLANADGFEVELVAGVDGGNLLDVPSAAPLG